MLAASAPALSSWSIDPPLVIVLGFGILYWVGAWRSVAPRRTTVERRWRTVSFYAGLAVVIIALDSPLDAFAARLFWVHMIQHVLLLSVAPPLIVLGRPWIRLWRPLPLPLRRSVAASVAHGGWSRPLRRLSRALSGPLAAFMLFNGVLLVWHLPLLFNATLHSTTLHILEHALFFSTALLFWKQVIASPPLRIRLNPAQRTVYLTAAMIVGWVLAIILATAPHPLYAFYAQETSRPGGISALADQHLAAGVMWVPGSLTFTIAILAYVHRWIAPSSAPPARVPARVTSLAGDH